MTDRSDTYKIRRLRAAVADIDAARELLLDVLSELESGGALPDEVAESYRARVSVLCNVLAVFGDVQADALAGAEG